MVVPSMRRILQGTKHTDPHAANKTLINQLMAAAKAVWDTPGDVLEHVTKWSMYLELGCMLHEMGMRQMMSAPHYHSTD